MIKSKVGYPWDDEWFHKLHNAVSNRGRSCVYCFQFISEKEDCKPDLSNVVFCHVRIDDYAEDGGPGVV